MFDKFVELLEEVQERNQIYYKHYQENHFKQMDNLEHQDILLK